MTSNFRELAYVGNYGVQYVCPSDMGRFGKLVGGMETLDAIERIGTDNKDAPVEEIKIEKVSVFVDPFQEVEEELKKQREEELAKASEELKMIAKPVEKKQKTTGKKI